jgi:hypothetical protein
MGPAPLRRTVASPPSGDRVVLNPLRSEDGAFRLLLYVLGALVLAIAVVLIIRAIA